MIDVPTGWSARAAVSGRSYLVTEDGFRRCQARLPFAGLKLHPDTAVSFSTELILAFWKNLPLSPAVSRSRPYKKNDNRFVEQKNFSEVRAYPGLDRLKTVTRSDETTHVKRRFDQARPTSSGCAPAAFSSPPGRRHWKRCARTTIHAGCARRSMT